jgi:hypothetical protein
VVCIGLETDVPRSRTDAGVAITIVGLNFIAGRFLVYVGQTQCQSVSLSTESAFSRIQCVLPPTEGGLLPVVVRDSTVGFSAGSVTFTSGLSITTVSPLHVGLSGGTTIFMTLRGASQTTVGVAVNVTTRVTGLDSAGQAAAFNVTSACIVKSVASDSLQCVMAAFPSAQMMTVAGAVGIQSSSLSLGFSDVVVSQFGVSALKANAIAFGSAYTPGITSVTPTRGPVYGGTVVVISGFLFQCPASGCIVDFDGSPCTVLSSSDSTIVCQTTQHTAATVRVTVRGNYGLAAPTTPTADVFRYVMRVDVIVPAVEPSVYPALVYSVTPTATVTPTVTPSSTESPSMTITPSSTPSVSSSPTWSRSESDSTSLTSTASESMSSTVTPTATKTSSVSLSSTPTVTPTRQVFSETRSASATRTASRTSTHSPTSSVSDSGSPTKSPSRSPSRSPSSSTSLSATYSPSSSATPTSSRSVSSSLSATQSISVSATPSVSSWAPVIAFGGDVDLDISGEGFGTQEQLVGVAKSLGLSSQVPTAEVNGLVFDAAVQAVTVATTAWDDANPLHPVIDDVQTISLLSADKTFELQMIQIISPNNTGGTFNVSRADGTKTSFEMVFLANASVMHAAITSLGLAPVVDVTYSRVLLGNGTDVVTWNVTYHLLEPVDPVVLNTANLLFPGVRWSVTRLRRGVEPFYGTWTLALPELGSTDSVELSYNATADDVKAALTNLQFPTVYGSLRVLSVERYVVAGPSTDFDGAGSITWKWIITSRLHPFEGIDPNGRLPTISLNGSGLIGGWGVALTCNHTVIGQAGRRSAHGSVTFGDGRSVVSLDIFQASRVEAIEKLQTMLPNIRLLDVVIVREPGWSANQNGFSFETGYGIGLSSVLSGVGEATTWIVSYVPSDMVDTCSAVGGYDREPFLLVDGSQAMGTNISWTTKQLRSFRCRSVDVAVLHHSDTNLRVHLPSLEAVTMKYPAYLASVLGMPMPVGWWRSVTSLATKLVANQGSFGGSALWNGSAVVFPGFSARDPDTSFLFDSTASNSLVVPFR